MKYILITLAALALSPAAFADPAAESIPKAPEAQSARVLASDDATNDHIAASATTLESLWSITEGASTVEIKGFRATR